jgi:rhodanese-related sulfurtransferase
MASIDPSALIAQIDAGIAPTIIDVRSRREFADGHVPGALHFPFWTMLFRAARIPRAKPVIVYCGHGPRARLAAAAMRLHGFRHVMYLEGHMSNWRREGLRQERNTENGQPYKIE